MSVGVGYRRTDIWHDRIGFRITGRGSVHGALMADLKLEIPNLRTENAFVDFYSKYEYSPQMDFYGKGRDSEKEDRTSYRLEDFGFDIDAGYAIRSKLRLGGTAGFYAVNPGFGKRSDVPVTQDVFSPEEAPGLESDTRFIRAGGFVQFDYRDNPRGPRLGGNYMLRARQYWEISSAEFDHLRVDFSGQQYFPYFNKTRVIALGVFVSATFNEDDQGVPVYLLPVLGGNDDLRGFERYRFHDDSSIYAIVEHRWHSFAGLDIALFFDVGQVAPRVKDFDIDDLRVDGGIGFRFKVHEAVIMRIDNAMSNEGYRFMWTFSNIF